MKGFCFFFFLAIQSLAVVGQIYTPNGTVGTVTNGTNNIGIGVATPVNPLQVEGSSSELNILLKNTGTNGARTYLSSFSGKSSIQTDKDFTIRTNYGQWADRFIVTNSGNVGIGPDLPKTRFDLGSLGGVMFRLHPGSQTSVDFSPFLHHDFLQGTYLQDGLSQAFISTGYVQDGRRKFHIGSATSSDFTTASFQPHFTVTSGGDVGIGTSGPVFRLDVEGFGARIKNPYTSDNAYTTFRLQGPDYTHGLDIDFFGNNNYSSDPTWSYGGGVGSAAIVNVNPKPLVLGTNNQARMLIDGSGNVSIGTTDAKGYRLAVAGKTVCEEVVVKMQGNWPDYVFDPDYKLLGLVALQRFIEANKHLPDVPTAEEVEKNGLSIGQMNAILLQKVEELTLHLIEQDRMNREQAAEIEELRNGLKAK